MHSFTALYKVDLHNVNVITPHALASVFTKLSKWFICTLVTLVGTKTCLVKLIFMHIYIMCEVEQHSTMDTFQISFDVRIPVHRKIIPNYNQQDATFLDLFISKDAVHVSGGSSAHHQEHTTVHTASGIVNQYCCQLLSWMRWNVVPSHPR